MELHMHQMHRSDVRGRRDALKRGIEGRLECGRTNGRRAGLRGTEESIWRKGWRWGVCEGEEEEEG